MPCKTMGIYNLYIGKGIIIPVKIFVNHFKSAVITDYNSDDKHSGFSREATLGNIVATIRPDLKIINLGHDALETRFGIGVPECDEADDNYEACVVIRQMIKDAISLPDLDIDYEPNSDLVFIGVFSEICDAELSYRIKVPEVIYGLPAFIPGLIRGYNKYSVIQIPELAAIFGQQPCIWTFAPDCACCT